jgi:hypothetical protein
MIEIVRGIATAVRPRILHERGKHANEILLSDRKLELAVYRRPGIA